MDRESVGVFRPHAVDTMNLDIDKMRNEFFKKSLSVGYHNVQYTWMQLMLMIISCIRSLESFEEGATSPSAQTLRDRLNLKGSWLESFHESMIRIARFAMKKFGRYQWYISVDETYVPFFGDRKKLNDQLQRMKLGAFVHGYHADTPGATGSFCFLVISLCCCKIRIPVAIRMMRVRERYRPWLEPQLARLRKLAPKAIILADRGFGKATWFYDMLDQLHAKYIVRTPVRKKENKNKIAAGATQFQYWMKESKTNNKVLLTVHVARDTKNRKYFLASNIRSKSGKYLLAAYLNRWDLENIFKDADRVELPTSSRNPLMRLFCIVLSFFLFTLWQLQAILNRTVWSLRGFVKKLITALCKLLSCIVSTAGQIQHHPP